MESNVDMIDVNKRAVHLSEINIKKDEYLLKYIYYDIYQKEENDIDNIENENTSLEEKGDSYE